MGWHTCTCGGWRRTHVRDVNINISEEQRTVDPSWHGVQGVFALLAVIPYVECDSRYR